MTSVDMSMDSSGQGTELQQILPKWKLPLSKSYTFSSSAEQESSHAYEEEARKSKDSESNTAYFDNYDCSDNSGAEESALISILLPCIICNRTFSPSALERHSKICTQVNQPERRSTRRVYDSHAQRIKNTKIADYVPGVDSPLSPPEESHVGCFDRSSKFRRSFGGTRSRESSFSSLTVPIHPSPTHRPRSRALSTPKTLEFETSSPDHFAADLRYDPFLLSSSTSEYGDHLPSYARALSPSSDCPYCLRNFGLKAFDRHVKFCKEIWERKQYDHQPTPKEKEIARERQEIRTKYKPMKGAISWSSLRSMSPGKELVGGAHDFATLALNKLFGNKNGHKTSQDSLHHLPQQAQATVKNSCSHSVSPYAHGSGLFSRSLSFTQGEKSGGGGLGLSRMSRIPTRQSTLIPQSTLHQNLNNQASNENLSTTSSVLKTPKTKSSPVSSSGYGPGGNYMSNFSRNSKLRSSMPVRNNQKEHHRVWTSENKRVEPEGLENPPPTLLISPMTYYNRNILNNQNQSPQSQQTENNKGNLGQRLDSDYYDPYAKAAQQFEELLKNQPDLIKSASSQNPNSAAKSNRKLGFNRALASVLGNDENKPKNNELRRMKSPRRNYNMLYASKDLDRTLQEDEPWYNNQRFTVDENYLKEMMSLGRGEDEEEKQRKNSESKEQEDEFVRLENLLREDSVPRDRETFGKRPNQTNSQKQISGAEHNESNHESLYSHRQQQKYTPHQSNGTQNTNLKYPQYEQIQVSLHLGPSKYCHHCGTTYPTPSAKFCINCGERRVINV